MLAHRTTMRRIKEVLRLKLAQECYRLRRTRTETAVRYQYKGCRLHRRRIGTSEQTCPGLLSNERGRPHRKFRFVPARAIRRVGANLGAKFAHRRNEWPGSRRRNYKR